MNKWGRWIGLIGTGLALVGIWGVWVPHRSAVLVLSLWDLAEFVKFVPGASATRELFYFPAWCAGIVLALIANQAANPPTGHSILKLARRGGVLVVALGVMLTILPPYPHVFNGYRLAEFRWRFFLGAIGVLAVLMSFLSRRLPVRAIGGLLVALALVGTIPALWQFLKVRGAIEAIYGASLGWGWGLGAFLAGWGLVGASGGQILIAHSKRRK
jgi:hypothetical protein